MSKSRITTIKATAKEMAKPSLDIQAQKMLKAAKLYCTAGRMAILKVLLKEDKPLNQMQITKRLGKEQFDKVTIYRTLESLSEVGLVHKAFIEKRAWHFELAHNCTESQCHPHFTCIRCGDTHCLTGMVLPMATSPHRGFIIHRQQVRLEGLCPICAWDNEIKQILEMAYLLRLLQKAILAFTAVCFMANTSGAAIFLHLHLTHHHHCCEAEHTADNETEHDDEHDTEHCSVCQQLLIAPGKFIAEPESSLPESNLQKDHVEFRSQSFVVTFRFNPFSPRPPPQFLLS